MADPYCANVVLLLHCDGVDGSTTLIDSSNSAHVILLDGGTQIDGSKRKFGTGSARLDLSGDGFYAPFSADWDFGGDDFTIELFINFDNLPSGHQSEIVTPYSSTGWALYIDTTTTPAKLSFWFFDIDSNFVRIERDWDMLSADVWHFIAANRVGTNFYLSADGVLLGSAYDIGSTVFDIPDGDLYFGTLSAFGTWFDEIRITKGIGRYLPPFFTAPTEAFEDCVLPPEEEF